MSVNFPTSLDNLTNPTWTDSVAVVDHAAQHSDVNDAIEALEAKVGIDDSEDVDSLDYKVSNIPVKASGAEVNTGTDDDKFATAKALADSDYEKNPMTTAGDIIYGGDDGTPTRLWKGTDGQVLTLASGNPSWADASGGGGGLLYFDTTQRSTKSITETSLSSYTLPGGTIASGKGLRIRAYWKRTGTNNAVHMRVKFGSAYIIQHSAPSQAENGFLTEIYVMNRDVSDQIATAHSALSKSSSPYMEISNKITDMTENTDADVVIDFRGYVVNGNDYLYLESATVELLS